MAGINLQAESLYQSDFLTYGNFLNSEIFGDHFEYVSSHIYTNR